MHPSLIIHPRSVVIPVACAIAGVALVSACSGPATGEAVRVQRDEGAVVRASVSPVPTLPNLEPNVEHRSSIAGAAEPVVERELGTASDGGYFAYGAR
jgi:hypothetical protein